MAPGDIADSRFSITVLTDCAQPVIQVDVVLLTDQEVTLDYLVTKDPLPGNPDFNQTGTVTVSPQEKTATILANDPINISAGDYHVEFYNPGSTEPVAVQSFAQARCLTVENDCDRVTFYDESFTPANPDVTVTYGEGPLAEADPADSTTFPMPQGGFRAVRPTYDILYWFAGTLLEGAGNNSAIVLAGEDEAVPVDRDCGPSYVTAFPMCTTPGEPARFLLDLDRALEESYRYTVTNTDGDVVLSRTVAADEPWRDKYDTYYSDALPGLGTYRLRFYLNGAQTPLYSSVFHVWECVQLESRCRSLVASNPEANPPAELVFPSELEGEDPGIVPLSPGETKTFPSNQPSVLVAPRVAGQGSPFNSALPQVRTGLGLSQIDIVEDCPPSPSPSPTEGGANDGDGGGAPSGDGLADTGLPNGSLVGLLAGLLLTASGGALLVARRQR